ncbi:hypothetical protein [Bradyrhizobium sp. CB1015]|uniref:hypothetical protein n=1 Tax=Bradyrhizobium sp. CB1015 TaxID=2976822 RepID=UPI0021AB05B2|nr:hypothetical protein [Bradyrhizobium sp. CB1015]UWU94395.1 hypothetical protein N2604_11385 [Bradyrhizobium sp. CB1015]
MDNKPPPPIALMDPPEANFELLSRAQVCAALDIERSKLRDLQLSGEFPEGIPYSPKGHIKKFPAYWVAEFKRRKLLAAQQALIAQQSRASKEGR